MPRSRSETTLSAFELSSQNCSSMLLSLAFGRSSQYSDFRIAAFAQRQPTAVPLITRGVGSINGDRNTDSTRGAHTQCPKVVTLASRKKSECSRTTDYYISPFPNYTIIILNQVHLVTALHRTQRSSPNSSLVHEPSADHDNRCCNDECSG